MENVTGNTLNAAQCSDERLSDVSLIFTDMKSRLREMLTTNALDGALAKEMLAEARLVQTAFIQITQIEERIYAENNKIAQNAGSNITRIRDDLSRQLGRIAERQCQA